jgi:hypothetical protein
MRNRLNPRTKQPQFSPFKKNLQVRYGAVHQLVLFRASTCIEPYRCPAISPLPESVGLTAGTVNQRLGAVRRLAYEATDSGLLSPELATGIRRVKGMKQLGARTGNRLTQDQARLLLEKANGDDLRSARDLAMLPCS